MGAVIKLGLRQSAMGDTETAAAAFQLAASSSDPHHNVRGAVNLWLLRSGSADRRAADTAYRQAAALVSRGFGDESDGAKSFTLGVKISSTWREFRRPARAAFQRGLDSGDPESVPLMALGLAGFERQELEEFYGDADSSSYLDLLDRVIGTGHPDHAPVAAIWLLRSHTQGRDVPAARNALRTVLEAGSGGPVDHAVFEVGRMFMETGHPDDAVDALRYARAHSPAGGKVSAAKLLGELLAARGDTEDARAQYRYVLDNTSYPHVRAEVQAALDRL